MDVGVPWHFQNFQTHPYFTATQKNRKGSIYRYLSGIVLFYVFKGGITMDISGQGIIGAFLLWGQSSQWLEGPTNSILSYPPNHQ